MNTLKLEMENCYGIQKIQQDIDFSKNNVAVIYAPNGTMKSSFAKTFEAIRDAWKCCLMMNGFRPEWK